MTKPDPLEWIPSPPPFRGWWNVSTSLPNESYCWSWWDGKRWSMLAFDFDNPAEAAKSARVPVHPIFNQITEWRWYYPDNARVPRIDPRTICRKCGAPMRPGKAIVTLATGTSDFGDGDVATMSPDPSKPKMIDCLKCEQCGWSVTP